MTRSRSSRRTIMIYAPPTRGVNNSVVVPARQSAGRRPQGAPGAAARDQRQGDRRDAVLGQLSAGQPSIIASTALGYVDLRAKLAYDPAQAKRCSTRPAGRWVPKAAPEGRQGAGLTAYESLPQPQNKETLQLVAQQWAQGRREAQRAGRRCRQPRRRQSRSAEDAGRRRRWSAAPIPT